MRVQTFAKVIVDGTFKSEDELVVMSENEGCHARRSENRGDVTLEVSVNITAGDTLKRLFTLQAERP